MGGDANNPTGTVPWISFASKRGGRRKWPQFLRGPIRRLCEPNDISARMQKYRLRARSHWFRSCSWKKLARSNESLRIQTCTLSLAFTKTENGNGVHTCGVQKPSCRDEECQKEIRTRNRAGTYVTDGIVSASELRVLSGMVVVAAVCGDQDCEKEGYCRERLHWSRSWKDIARQPAT